jgi:hypothetical protein
MFWVGLLILGTIIALGVRPFVRSVWGACFSRDCAYLPTSPTIGALFISGWFLAFIAAAIWQLSRLGPPAGELAALPRQEGTRTALRQLTTNRARLALLLVLVLAAALRLERIEISSFKWGEAISSTLGAAVLTDGRINLIGVVSSQDIPQLPGYSYLLAPIAAVTRNPAVLAVFGATLSLLAVYLCAVVGRRWFGIGIGLIAALLFAVGFWPVQCGSRVWQQCFLPPTSLLYLDAVLLLALARQPWALVLASLWAGVMTHLHILSPLYLLMLPLAMVPAWRQLRLMHVVAAALVFVALISPYLLWEVTPNVYFRDIRHILQSTGEGTAYFDLAPLRFLAELASAGGAEHLLAPNAEEFGTTSGPWASLTWIGAGLAVAGMAASAYHVLARRPTWVAHLFLILALIAPTLLLWRHSVDIFAHYLYGAMPMLALLGATACIGFSRLARGSNTLTQSTSKAISAAVLASTGLALALYSIASIQTILNLNRLIQQVESDEYGVPARYTWQATQAAEAAWRNAGSENPIFVGGHRNDIAPILYMLGNSVPGGVTTFDDCKQVPTAQAMGPAVLLLWNADSPAADRLNREGSNAQVQLLPRPGPPDFAVYVVDSTRLDGAPIPEEDASRRKSCTGRV